MKIDISAHIVPEKYKNAMYKQAGVKYPMMEASPTLFNLEDRFRIMDKFDHYVQVLVPSGQPIESIAEGQKAADLAKMYNDEMAELVAKYPDRFVSAVAVLPMDDIESAMKELDRAINDLRFRGVFIHTPVHSVRKDKNQPSTTKPIDSPELMPIYKKMADYDLPIWLHPYREHTVADYSSETRSKYQAWQIFGWPYESTIAMTRLVFGGTLQKYPTLKFITHHCGAMVPYFEQRISVMYSYSEMRSGRKYTQGLTKSPVEYFRMFYADTALSGSTPALMCGYEFFGAERILFGTDMPYDSQIGYGAIIRTIESIERMDIPVHQKDAIFAGNAMVLLRLPI